MAQLTRRLGFVDAVTLGLASMIGAGVFVVFAPAAQSAGSGLLIGLGIAAVIALCNALSSAQLAAAYPVSGGAYTYGRERLGEWPGFLAGWSFVVGKIASCAAMSLAFATYAAPAGWEKPIAIAAVVGLVGLSSFGISRTAALARVLVLVVLATLALVLASGYSSPHSPESQPAVSVDAYGVLQSAGLLFFAFAGFARLATLGEEVKSPTKTIPRAILTALAIVLALYLLIAIALLTVLGPERLAGSSAPLADLVAVSGWDWASPIVIAGAAAGSLGALLALIAGVGRTMLAMARNDDLPRGLAAVSTRFGSPARAELLIATVVTILILTVDLREVIGFSSFGVLLYYFIANSAAFTQTAGDRRYPRALNVLGAVGCVVLVATLPWQSIVAGILLLVAGAAYRLTTAPTRRRSASGNTADEA